MEMQERLLAAEQRRVVPMQEPGFRSDLTPEGTFFEPRGLDPRTRRRLRMQQETELELEQELEEELEQRRLEIDVEVADLLGETEVDLEQELFAELEVEAEQELEQELELETELEQEIEQELEIELETELEVERREPEQRLEVEPLFPELAELREADRLEDGLAGVRTVEAALRPTEFEDR
jgi:DNA repair exonuclease SbcCD nuclease subunit